MKLNGEYKQNMHSKNNNARQFTLKCYLSMIAPDGDQDANAKKKKKCFLPRTASET